MRSATRFLVLFAVLLSAGCLGAAPTADQTQTVTTTATPIPTETPTPTPPISEREALNRATTYHEKQTVDMVDHYDSYSVGLPTARVTDRTGAGVYVHVQQEYSYTTETTEADGVNEATYFVNETVIRQTYW
ncbi:MULTISPECIES: hypothetical protein [Haloferax]|uniref:Uncharacterized protein n=2 Tax=Haloferax TaxID=2251 RepID=A0A6G1YZ18_9EURY|nr:MULTISPECIES: hypothetical protein [Haloferax]KAB1186885.1 hypothetical protein Hfx1149_02115 [Haloferax sp. CBA1149]MRW79516.1 hypothetical protein [Haloferax marinisediminis]